MTEAQMQADVAEATAKPPVEPETVPAEQAPSEALLAEITYPKPTLTPSERVMEGGFKLRKVQIEVKEWEELGAGPVFIREMTALERDEFEKEMNKLGQSEEAHSYRVELLFRTVCKENGKRFFTDGQHEALNELPTRVVQKLWIIANKINALSEADLEELAKNLEKVERGASS